MRCRARRVGDIADAVYFILKGTVSISDESGRLLTKLAQGSHFGEFGILAYLDGQLGGWGDHGCMGEPLVVWDQHLGEFGILAHLDGQLGAWRVP